MIKDMDYVNSLKSVKTFSKRILYDMLTLRHSDVLTFQNTSANVQIDVQYEGV